MLQAYEGVRPGWVRTPSVRDWSSNLRKDGDCDVIYSKTSYMIVSRKNNQLTDFNVKINDKTITKQKTKKQQPASSILGFS